MTDSERTLHRTKIYYSVVFGVLGLGLALGLFFLDQAPWILIITGCLLGGFAVDATLAVVRHRRAEHHTE